MANKFSDLRAKMSDESRRRSHEKAEAYRLEKAQDKRREPTKHTDLYIRTLNEVVECIGVVSPTPGRLERMAKTAGATNRNIMPRIQKASLKASIAACCCNIPSTIAQAR